MLKVASFDIVFQEIPGEVTLALNLSNCPCHCPGCHSQHLAEDIGEELTTELMDGLIARYGAMITCVAFMGGDSNPDEVAQWAEYVKNRGLKTAWYSGRNSYPNNPRVLDFLKLGPYIEALGGLKSPTTNQRLYKREDDSWVDITSVFWKNNLAN
jgi:anaerobic ribonucleoside-triphosphate reductase activating protein